MRRASTKVGGADLLKGGYGCARAPERERLQRTSADGQLRDEINSLACSARQPVSRTVRPPAHALQSRRSPTHQRCRALYARRDDDLLPGNGRRRELPVGAKLPARSSNPTPRMHNRLRDAAGAGECSRAAARAASRWPAASVLDTIAYSFNCAGAGSVGQDPAWGHSRSWGYGPSGGIGLALLIVLILFLMGKI